MDLIQYFRHQSKNLLKDYKTRKFAKKWNRYVYQPNFFDIKRVFEDFEYDDKKSDFTFTLQNAQHVIARLAGFDNWKDLKQAKPNVLELAYLLFDNAHKISNTEWNDWYIPEVEKMNDMMLDIDMKIDIFKQVFLESDEHRSEDEPYRLDLKKKWEERFVEEVRNEDEVSGGMEDFYEELDEREKQIAIRVHQDNGFNYSLKDSVECLHCGERFSFNEVNAIRKKTKYRSFLDFDEIVCKNFPKCNGNILDLMRVNKVSGNSTKKL